MLECFEKFIKNITNFDFIVDVGCGNGINMLKLKKLGYAFVEGCDNSDEMLGQCKEKNLNVTKANIIDLQYEDSKYDITLCMNVLHHLETHELRKKAIKELLRITKNDGLIFISVNEYYEREKNDYIIKQGENNVFYHLFEMYELTNLCNGLVGHTDINELWECSHRIVIIQVRK